jgi:protein-disulfide isomerase
MVPFFGTPHGPGKFVPWFIVGLLFAMRGGVAAAQMTTVVPEVVATVQGQPITAEELLGALKGELLRLEMQRYQLLKDKLDDVIAARLMALEAAQRGVTVPKLEQDEIGAKIPQITTDQAKAFYEANKSRMRQPFEQMETRILAHLQQQERDKRLQTLVGELQQRYPVAIALSAPRVEVSVDNDPFKGPKDAPVTIIEFSDFQCPFCRRVQPTLKRLLEEYPNKIKHVFRDFPLRNIHPEAQKAAEAAQCAEEQDTFWPYHDKLFEMSGLQVSDLKQYAKDLGLNTEAFDKCLDSDKYAQEIEADFQDGQNAGVSATPAFFINGQPLSGAVPYERFKELVDAVLAQVESAKKSN